MCLLELVYKIGAKFYLKANSIDSDLRKNQRRKRDLFLLRNVNSLGFTKN